MTKLSIRTVIGQLVMKSFHTGYVVKACRSKAPTSTSKSQKSHYQKKDVEAKSHSKHKRVGHIDNDSGVWTRSYRYQLEYCKIKAKIQRAVNQLTFLWWQFRDKVLSCLAKTGNKKSNQIGKSLEKYTASMQMLR